MDERLPAGRALFLAAIAFLAFVAGGWLVAARIFPGTVIRQSYSAAAALWAKDTGYVDRYSQTDHWRPARTVARGVTAYVPSAAYPGYTLYTSGDAARAVLVSMSGRIVHQWQLPFSKVWNRSAAVRKPRSDALIFWDKARLLPDGGLLVLYESAGDTPWGYGMARIDRDSRLVWSFLQHTHHDFDIGPDGRIYVLTNAFTSRTLPGFDFLARPRLSDALQILSPDGKPLDTIPLTEALAQSQYHRLLNAIPQFSLADPLHTNSVQLITPALAAHFPFGKPGDVLLSFRDLGAIAVLDPQRRVLTWLLRGSWLGQHDVRLLPDGHLLMFDNLGGYDSGHGPSRALEIDPVTQQVVWQYSGDVRHPLDSALRGRAQREPNGNTLITEADGGRLVEVTPQGQIAWEYINPVRGGGHARYLPVLCSGQRIDPQTLTPGFRALLQGDSHRSSAS
jgi:hypothetical protein